MAWGAAMAPGWVVRVCGNVDHGWFMVSCTVRSSTTFTSVTVWKTAPVSAEARWALKLAATALASHFSPSWKVTPGRILIVHTVKSALEVMDWAR